MGGPAVVVFHLRLHGPVAGLGRVVSWFPSGGSCGCCPWSRLAGGVARLGEAFDWLLGFVAVAAAVAYPPGWWVCTSWVLRAGSMACSGRFLLVRGWGFPPPFCFGVG